MLFNCQTGTRFEKLKILWFELMEENYYTYLYRIGEKAREESEIQNKRLFRYKLVIRQLR